MESADPLRRLRVAQRLVDLRAAEAARLALAAAPGGAETDPATNPAPVAGPVGAVPEPDPDPAPDPDRLPAADQVAAPTAAPALAPPYADADDDGVSGTWQGQESAARRIAAMLRGSGGRGIAG